MIGVTYPAVLCFSLAPLLITQTGNEQKPENQVSTTAVTPDLQGQWTSYRIIDPHGNARRLQRLTVELDGDTDLQLFSGDGVLMDAEPVQPWGRTGKWYLGFWVPEENLHDPYFELKRIKDDATKTQRVIPNQPPKGEEAPLRLDQTGEALYQHMLKREQPPSTDTLADFVPDMEQYLQQHRLIYERPAEDWIEGLMIGNGQLGTVVTGVQGKTQSFSLDRCDIWGTRPSGTPIGRCYGSWLHLHYQVEGNDYLQELSLYRAEVHTRDGQLTSIARVNALCDVLEIELHWAGSQPLPIKIGLTRPAIPIGKLDTDGKFIRQAGQAYGNFTALLSDQEIKQAKERMATEPCSQLETEINGKQALIHHTLPNMSYAMGITMLGASVTWQDISEPRTAKITAESVIPAGGKITLLAGIATDRQNLKPEEHVRLLLDVARIAHEAGDTSHRQWWADFWKRSFIEIPDKLIENLWYFGVYHQAIWGRGPDAPSFFGQWFPHDFRAWLDSFTMDMQTEMTFAAPLPTGHTELMYPSHNFWAYEYLEFLEHHRGPGLMIPHFTTPSWAGGHDLFDMAPIIAGESGYFVCHNFWRDYQYTGDKKFLRDIGYPYIAGSADYAVSRLTLGDDGKYHALASHSPEQENTSNDNIHDRACIEANLRAAIQASQILKVDAERAAVWQDRLDKLFDYPQYENTLAETSYNPHPYRCHAVILFPIFPMNTLYPGHALWEKARNAYDVMLSLVGYNYAGRHDPIPNHMGGIEPCGHSFNFWLAAAARTRDWGEYLRLFHGVVARGVIKRNGCCSVADYRHTEQRSRVTLCEGVSGQVASLCEMLVQNYEDHTRIMPTVGKQGLFRFAGLRGFGGFVLAGECLDGQMRQLVIHSLRGNTLRINNPWPGQELVIQPETIVRQLRLADGTPGLEIETKPGLTYRLHTQPSLAIASPTPFIEKRSAPREVMLKDGYDFRPILVIYPEDLPPAQINKGDRMYLGIPRENKSQPLTADFTLAKKLAESTDWPARQTAARWLGRLSTQEATDLLVTLVKKDPSAVVRNTAAVALVIQNTEYATQQARQLAAESDKYLKAEIESAFMRWEKRRRTSYY